MYSFSGLSLNNLELMVLYHVYIAFWQTIERQHIQERNVNLNTPNVWSLPNIKIKWFADISKVLN
jgi:hypothetical protein